MEEVIKEEPIVSSPQPRRKIIITLSVVAAILFLIIGSFFFFWQRSKGTSQKTAPTPVASGSLPQIAKTAPSVAFSSYTNQATFPIVPSSIKQYVLKTDFSLDETKAFAKQFGLIQYKATDQDNPVFYSEDKNTRGMLVFNKETGTFSYQSWGILKPTTIGTTSTATALSFLKQIGVYDDTITCGITYKRTIAPKDLTFVECHRMPDSLGAILLNPVGILNLPEHISLSSLKVGLVPEGSPNNSTIENVSTGQNGKARPNDFNTITVGVFPDGNIFSVDSTIRWTQEEKQIPSDSILSPQEALDQFTKHNATFSLTIPAGAGKLNWDTVYPQNKAEAEIATITDFSFIYIEKPINSKQTTYIPNYFIRGTARLKSGYVVKFVQTVSALRDTTVLGSSTKKDLAQIQINPYYPTITQALSPSPTKNADTINEPSVVTSPIISPVEITQEAGECDMEGELAQNENLRQIINEGRVGQEFTLELPDLGNITIVSYAPYVQSFFLKSSSFVVQDMVDLRNKLEESYKKNPGAFADSPLAYYGLGSWNLRGFTSCYITSTGISPAIFIYSEKPQNVGITLLASLTYSDPLTINNKWDILLDKKGLLYDQHYNKRDYLYYEYDASKVIFKEQKEGYVVRKGGWEKVAENITSQLELNEKESQALFFDIKNALPKVKTEYMKISLIDEDEINQKLPLQITPQPETIHRIHLLLTPQDKQQSIISPVIKPLSRDGFTLIELGVAIGS